MTTDKMKMFRRCVNPFDIPESLCALCLRTIVARDWEALERAENSHCCNESTYGAAHTD